MNPWDVWQIEPDWAGEVAFIVGGGPSAGKQNIELLKGRKVIAINCSGIDTVGCPALVPFADYLIFADMQFYNHYKNYLLQFKGTIVSCASNVSISVPPMKRLHRKSQRGLCEDRHMVMIRDTTLTAAINLAVHLGARAIVLLGADGKPDANGKMHHHAEHPFRQVRDCWNRMKGDLRAVADDLRKLGIPCLNASPDSAWAEFWPVMNLEQAIEQTAAADYGNVGHWRQFTPTRCIENIGKATLGVARYMPRMAVSRSDGGRIEAAA